MKKPKLLDQIAEDAKQSPIKRDANRVAILALLVEIKEALDAGWSMKRIWKILRDRGSISFSYQAFTVHVNRLILTDDKQKHTSFHAAKNSVENETKKPDIKPDDKPKQVTPKEKIDTNVIKGFVYDPTKFSKEDLL